MKFPSDVINAISREQSKAATESQRLKKEADEARRTARFWTTINELAAKGWSMHILDLVGKEQARLKKMRADEHPAIPAIEKAYRLAKEDKEKIMRRYPALIEKAAGEANLQIDKNSRHPKYIFANGFFKLEVNESKGTARLSDNEGKLAEHPANVDAVVETLQREYKRVFERKFNGKKFLKRLRKYYKDVLKKEKQQDGSSIPIRHITRRMGKNLKRFRTDEFLVDLSRLAEKGPFEIDGRKLDLQQTKDTNQGMLLYGAASRGYVGFIVFKEA